MQKDNKKYKILVVEDNPGDYILIEDYLTEQILQPEIIHVSDFAAVVKLFSGDRHDFDTVFLDLSLPDKSGEELIKEIVLLIPHSPIIVLTGYSDIAFSIKSISYGISDYLLKDELSSVSLYKSLVYNIERKKTLKLLEESERRYNHLFHMSPQPMWVFDTNTFRFLDVNDAAISQYGYSLQEFLGMTIKDIRPEEDISLIEESVEKRKKQESAILKRVFRHRKKSGEIINVDIYSRSILFNGHEAKIILANDITERLNYIQEIEHQNKILQEIAWTQSHEVRAPLARIMGLVNLISNHKITEEERTELLGYILLSAEEFDAIIKKVVDKTSRVLPKGIQ